MVTPVKSPAPRSMTVRVPSASKYHAGRSPGADKETFDQKGRTPLHRAVDNGRLDVARFLLEARADPCKNDLAVSMN